MNNTYIYYEIYQITTSIFIFIDIINDVEKYKMVIKIPKVFIEFLIKL